MEECYLDLLALLSFKSLFTKSDLLLLVMLLVPWLYYWDKIVVVGWLWDCGGF